MSVHPQAGQVATRDKLANIPLLCSEYYVLTPDVSQQAQRVSFGTSGHRGSALLRSGVLRDLAAENARRVQAMGQRFG